MSSEEELKKWLNRPEKTILENFQFAVKAWKSAEFAITTKYEIILTYFTENFTQIWKLDEQETSFKNIEEFLDLKCPSPGLIQVQTKINCILIFIKMAKKFKNYDTRKICELLYQIIEYECFQDCYKQNYNEFCSIFGLIFRKYNNYLQQHYSGNEFKFSISYERDFFDIIIKNLRDFIHRLPENCVHQFSEVFSTNTLIPLIEVTIILKLNTLQYFNDILEIEKSLYLDYTKTILKNYLTYPIHINLMNFECGLINFRGNIQFYVKLIDIVFNKLQISDEFSTPQTFLIVNSYLMELLKKYDVQLNFDFHNQTIIQFLSKKIENYVNTHCQNNLYEILCLLCSTIRLNPLILEHNIFKITPKLLVAKKTDKDYEKFEEYMILLMDMYKKLSRPEKFIANLLKSIKEYLLENQLSKKLKRKMKSESENSIKLIKTDELNNSIISQCSENLITDENNEEINIYLKIMFNNLNTETITDKIMNSNVINFPYITFAWNSQNIGRAFSKFISTLMSKPSLVVWKTLIYTMLEHIESLKTFIKQSNELSENLLFLIDLNASLLCQYFIGTRLIEQTDKFENEINENRNLTSNLLKMFGQTILNLEHNKRIMNAFLQISYFSGYFDLILWYYSPDSLKIDYLQLSKTIHNYLTSNEWTLIEQRIVNFGKRECKINMNRIFLQQIKTKLIFQQEQDKNNQLNIKTFLLSNTLGDTEQMKAIFYDPTNIWLIKYLTREQKYEICKLIISECIDNIDENNLIIFQEDQEFFEIIILNLYKNLVDCFQSKKSILLLIDFEELLNSTNQKKRIDKILTIIKDKDENYLIKKYSIENIEKILQLIKKLPIGYLKIDYKILIFSIHLALYRDIIATENDKLINLCFEMFDDILHFGRQIEIFKYFNIENFLRIFPPLNSNKFYEFLFHTLRKTDGNAEKCLEKIIEILQEDQPNLTINNLKLTMIIIEALSHQTNYKNFKNYLEIILQIYGNYINNYFIDDDRQNSTINDKKFVENTLQSYSIYVNSILSKAIKPNAEISDQITEKFRKICKIYIGYSIDCHNTYAIRLINCALNYRVQLHFDSDEIQFVMQKYWDQLKIDFRNDVENDENIKNSEAAIKLVMMHKGPEDFRNILMEIGKDTSQDNIGYICRILTQIAHCQLGLVKGAILNEHFKRITFEILLNLKKDIKTHQYEDIPTIINLLKTMKIICENIKIPMSPDHIDDILTFLIDINVKKFQLTDTNGKLYKILNLELLELCTMLIKYRHQMITDRIPQFIYIFKDLLQSICWYKCDRQKNSTLLTEEIDDLTELAQKLESLMHLIASHSLDVKRVAPYLLTFAISLMVTNTRSTTLYPKIKTHIESICYDLISVCDHRVGSFILRCSNDATKQVYETLCKEYKKYHKFKGKV